MWKKLQNTESIATSVILLLFILSRMINLGLIGHPTYTSDTGGYLRISLLPLGNINFWAGNRLFLYPLLIKVLWDNLEVLALFQMLFSIFAWALLAFSFSRYFSNAWLRFTALTAVLLFSNNMMIIPWDTIVMTESLNFSLFAMLIALTLLFPRNEKRWITAFLIVVVSIWIFVRETNGWLALTVSPVLLLCSILLKKKHYLFTAIAIYLAFAIVYLLGGIENGMSQRWVIPLLDVIAQKILKREERVQWFEAHGMPVSVTLMELKGEYTNGQENLFYTSPDLEAFRKWLIRDGRKTYISFLLHHPDYLLFQPFKDPSYLSLSNNDENIPDGFKPILPGPINKFLLINVDSVILLRIGIAACALALLLLILRRNGFWLVLSLMALLVYPHLIVAWHGDAAGLSRHALLANIELRLAPWMILLAALQEVLSRIPAQRHAENRG